MVARLARRGPAAAAGLVARISPASPLHLGCISPASRLYLGRYGALNFFSVLGGLGIKVQRIAELSERVQVKDDYASGEAEATEGRPGSSGTKGHRSNEQSGGLGLSGSRANLDNRSQQNE